MHTLLLADDSVTIQRVIELTFADEDVRVVAVSDGGEAIAMLNQTPPDIVLADVGMPGQNGYEVARHIRDTPGLAHIPIVLLTGAFEPIDQAKVAEVGCDGVLAKPFEPQLVIARVKELLARHKDATYLLPVAGHEATPGPRPADVEPASRAELDNYFDRLDAAFSNLPSAQAQGSVSSEPPPTADADADDWTDAPAPVMAATPSSRPDDEPLEDRPLPAAAADTLISEQTPVTRNWSSGLGATPAALPAWSPPPAFPPLADAFTALLAAEQAAPGVGAAPEWPVIAAPPDPPPAPVLPDNFIEQVTQRVLDQLSDRVMRETTAEIVSAVAERLVKEEIERIKRQINGGAAG